MQLRRDRHALFEINCLARGQDVGVEAPGRGAGCGEDLAGFGTPRGFVGGGGGRGERESERGGGERGLAAVRAGQGGGGAVQVQEQGQQRGEEGVKHVERVRGRERGGVDAQRVGAERERQQRGSTRSGGREEADGARGGVDGEGEGGRLAVRERRVDEVVARRVAIPQQVRGLGLARAADGFRLQVVAVVAGQVVRDGDGGGLLDGHELGESGEDAGKEGGASGGGVKGRAGYGDRGRGVEGVGARDGEGRGGGAEGVDGGEGGGEGDGFERWG